MSNTDIELNSPPNVHVMVSAHIVFPPVFISLHNANENALPFFI